MPITQQFASDLWALILANQNLTPIGSDGLKGATIAGSLYVSLHTAAPAGNAQNSNEWSDANYARQAIARSVAAVESTGAYQYSNKLSLTFPAAASPATITHVGLGTAANGAGYLLGWAALATPAAVDTGMQVAIAVGNLDLTFAPCP